MTKHTKAIFFAILAAVLYALNSPFSKLLLNDVPTVMMAAFLYLGAGFGMLAVSIIKGVASKVNNTSLTIKEIEAVLKLNKYRDKDKRLTKVDLPYTIAMVVLDIAAPILLIMGLHGMTAENVSLLSNFEIVATALVAYIVFKEKISRWLWAAIIMVTLACVLLSFKDIIALRFSYSSLFVLFACVCWGIENNCTKILSAKDPLQIVVIKGIFSGMGSLVIACVMREQFPKAAYIALTMILGFITYGLSIFFYIRAQRNLGAARTSTYYAIAPFVGVLMSLIIFKTLPEIMFYVALALMAVGTWLATKDNV